MKPGDLVRHVHAPKGKGRVRMIYKFGYKQYNYIACLGGYNRQIIIFSDGAWDWKSDWTTIKDK